MLTQALSSHRSVHQSVHQTVPASEYGSAKSEATFDRSKRLAFLHSVLEGFVDGILILSEQGDILHANTHARRMCRQFVSPEASLNQAPAAIWRVCQALIASRDLFPDQKTMPEMEVDMDDRTTLRVRVRWIDLSQIQQSCLLVTLENRSQSIRNLAIADSHKYGLTPRETEVWALRRAGYSYKDIANKLYITHNTVKRHIKNILAKQQDIL